jgi:hypothetical protein
VSARPLPAVATPARRARVLHRDAAAWAAARCVKTPAAPATAALAPLDAREQREEHAMDRVRPALARLRDAPMSDRVAAWLLAHAPALACAIADCAELADELSAPGDDE